MIEAEVRFKLTPSQLSTLLFFADGGIYQQYINQYWISESNLRIRKLNKVAKKEVEYFLTTKGDRVNGVASEAEGKIDAAAFNIMSTKADKYLEKTRLVVKLIGAPIDTVAEIDIFTNKDLIIVEMEVKGGGNIERKMDEIKSYLRNLVPHAEDITDNKEYNNFNLAEPCNGNSEKLCEH